jgi:hypothetical protein
MIRCKSTDYTCTGHRDIPIKNTLVVRVHLHPGRPVNIVRDDTVYGSRRTKHASETLKASSGRLECDLQGGNASRSEYAQKSANEFVAFWWTDMLKNEKRTNKIKLSSGQPGQFAGLDKRYIA